MLIVEDDKLSVVALMRMFKNEYDINDCDSFEEYDEKYKDINFDIIIMDISLKGTKSGFELIKYFKEAPSYNGAPIICLTAHSQNTIKQTAFESGADEFLTKPVRLSKLKEMVESLSKQSA